MANRAYRRSGSDFLVNTTTTGGQSDSSIAALADGGFIISWTDASATGGDTSGNAIRSQRYDASGVAVGSEFLVNTSTAGSQEHSTVTGLASGGYVISWTDFSLQGGDASGASIKAQLYDASGARVGTEFLVNTATANNQSEATITALSNGGFVISWSDLSLTGTDRSASAVRGQIFSADGSKVGSAFVVNTTVAATQYQPSISATSDGGFVVSWADNSRLGGDASGYAIKAQRFDAAGTKLGVELLVNTTTTNNQLDPTITTLASGKFVVAWTDSSFSPSDPDGTAIRAQLFNADGTRAGSEFLVNTVTKFTQQQPVVTALPTGGFAISWSDNSNIARDYSSFGIKTQFFDDDGAKVGTEFLVNTTTVNSQERPTITALASGALAISWTDFSLQGGDASGTSIKAQIITPASGVITDIGLSSTTFSEASADNTAVAAFSANGALNAAYSYDLIGDSTGGAFRIEGNRLIVSDNLKLDYETSPGADITVRATDTFGNSFLETIHLSITDALRESRFSAGAEVLANTETTGGQGTSTVTHLASGGFVVTWQDGSSVGPDASGFGIKAQLFDKDGAKMGNEFLVNTVTSGNQSQPASGSLSDGGFVVVWSDASPSAGLGGSAIIAQRFDADGVKVGGETVVDVSPTFRQTDASVTGLETGGYVITWTDSSGQNGDASGAAILARVFDAAGNPVGAERLINVETANAQTESAVTALGNGGFAVVWRDASLLGGDASSSAIKGRLFDGAGNATSGEFLVNTSLRSAQLQPQITQLAGGGFVVVWTDNSSQADPDYYGVRAQIFTDNGTKVGAELLVNTSTAGAQQQPVVAPLASGGFIVTWYDFSGAGAEEGTPGVRAQAFNALGQPLGSEISVNSDTLGTQGDPSVAALASGAFAISYTDNSSTGGDVFDTAVKVRVFKPVIDPNATVMLRAVDDNMAGIEDTTSVFTGASILANDINGNQGILTLTGVTAVAGGTVVLNADGTIAFTPNPNFDGRASFDYTVEDGTGAVDVGRVFVQVAGVNDAPTANNDSVAVAEDGVTTILGSALTANDTDPDTGDVRRVIAVPATTAGGLSLTLLNGNVLVDAGGTFNALAAGQTATDSFSYTIADNGGLTSSASVTVTIVGANDAPGNLTLSNARVDENAANGTVVGTVAATDVDTGDVLRYSLTVNAGGRFAIDAATGLLTVANSALLDFEAASSHLITYRATDASGAFVELSTAIQLNDLPEPRFYNGDNGANIFTAPTNDLWTIRGNGGNDILSGNASADTIFGDAGNDVLDGRGGADMLLGGIGADTYFVDNIGDVIVENFGEGVDVVNASVTYTLPENVENLTLTGTGNIGATGNSFNNTINGNSGNNVIDGADGRDLIVGGAGDDVLIGNTGADWLMGGEGSDTLIGGAGSDELTGGTGADRFVFDGPPVAGEVDLFRDFTHGEDSLAFSVSAFTAFAGEPLGALSPSAFVSGPAATTAAQHLIYNPVTGGFFYDIDGVGGSAAIQIGTMAKGLIIDASDIVLIA